jgi:thiol:disulfide interchange protein DsbG
MMKIPRPIAFAAALIAVAVPPGAKAAAPSSPMSAPMPPAVLAKLERQGLQVDKSFPAVGGLTGFIVSHHLAQPMVVYVTADEHMLVGSLLDAQGDDLGPGYLKQYAAKINLGQFAHQLAAAPAVLEGAGAPGVPARSIIYVFFDPNCIFCHLTWKMLQPYETSGVQVRWLPVGLLKPQDSAGKAAALLDAKDPSSALRTLETRYVESTESGGIPPELPIPARTQFMLDGNAKLMSDMGYVGTPTIIYHDHEGTLQAHEGLPTLSSLPSILGVPEKNVADPELQRYR